MKHTNLERKLLVFCTGKIHGNLATLTSVSNAQKSGALHNIPIGRRESASLFPHLAGSVLFRNNATKSLWERLFDNFRSDIYHPRMWVGNVFGHVCLSVCLCVCLSVILSVQAITFEPLDIET